MTGTPPPTAGAASRGDHLLSRRRVLGGLGTLATLSGIAATTACGSNDRGPGTGPSAGTVTLPTYKTIEGITPDLPGTDSGIPAGFLTYPRDPKSAATKPTGSGAITALLSSYAVAPRPAAGNPYLAELNKQLGHDLQLQVIPAADYPTKLATTVSGGTLPDLLEMLPNQPQLPQLLAATCADLTDFVADDAIADYPNLAAFSTDMWRTTVFGNRIYGVPVPRPLQSGVPFIRTDLFEKQGLSADVKSWDEFTQLCAALTDPKSGRFALSQPPIAYLTGALGGCNEWRLDGDKLVRYQETEQYRQAVLWCAELNSKGFIHPDAFGPNATVQGKQRLVGGKVGIHPDGYSAWGSLARFLPEGQQEVIGGLAVRGFEGAKPSYQVSAGSSNFTVLKKADKGRVAELLSVLNYLAAPFGSKEFLFRKYGTIGEQSSMERGNPVLNKAGTDQITPVTEGLDYHLADGVKVAYEGSLTEITRRKYAFAKAAEPGYVRSPVIGLYSETFAKTNATYLKTIADVESGVIAGRKKISALDDALREWNAGDGKTIKAEFDQARHKQ